MFVRILAAAALAVVLASPAAAQEPPPATPKALTEVQTLRGEVGRLKLENERLRELLAQANQRVIAAGLQALEAEYLATVQAPAGSTWDWSRMVAVPPPAAPAKP